MRATVTPRLTGSASPRSWRSIGARLVVRGSVAGHYVDLDEEGDFMGHDTAVGAIVGPFLGSRCRRCSRLRWSAV